MEQPKAETLFVTDTNEPVTELEIEGIDEVFYEIGAVYGFRPVIKRDKKYGKVLRVSIPIKLRKGEE